MLTSWDVIADAEQKAFDMLICPVMEAGPKIPAGVDVMLGADVIKEFPAFSYLVDDPASSWVPNVFQTLPRLVTSPAVIKQELLLANTPNYSFIFQSTQTPSAGPILAGGVWANNIPLALNNVMCIYGIRFRVGYDDVLGQQRVYQTYGQIPGDNFIYNGTFSLKVEQEVQVDQVNMDDFKEVPQGSVRAIQKYDGCQIIRPLRLYSGQLGKLIGSFAPFNSNVGGLTLSEGAVVECSLLVVQGQASASGQ